MEFPIWGWILGVPLGVALWWKWDDPRARHDYGVLLIGLLVILLLHAYGGDWNPDGESMDRF